MTYSFLKKTLVAVTATAVAVAIGVSPANASSPPSTSPETHVVVEPVIFEGEPMTLTVDFASEKVSLRSDEGLVDEITFRNLEQLLLQAQVAATGNAAKPDEMTATAFSTKSVTAKRSPCAVASGIAGLLKSGLVSAATAALRAHPVLGVLASLGQGAFWLWVSLNCKK